MLSTRSGFLCRSGPSMLVPRNNRAETAPTAWLSRHCAQGMGVDHLDDAVELSVEEAAAIAAPSASAVVGLHRSAPTGTHPSASATADRTAGIWLLPPIIRTAVSSPGSMRRSSRQASTGSRAREMRSWISSENSSWVISTPRPSRVMTWTLLCCNRRIFDRSTETELALFGRRPLTALWFPIEDQPLDRAASRQPRHNGTLRRAHGRGHYATP